jgi:hypothetical protein
VLAVESKCARNGRPHSPSSTPSGTRRLDEVDPAIVRCVFDLNILDLANIRREPTERTASFVTPISLIQAPTQTTTTRRTLLSRCRDHNSVYELQEEDFPEQPIPTYKEQASDPTSRPAIGSVSGHQADPGPSARREAALQEPAAKRKEYAVQRRCQSLKSVAGASDKAFLQLPQHGTLATQKCHRSSTTQLTTQPYSAKRQKIKKGASGLDIKARQNPQFRNARITKSLELKGKGRLQELPAQSVIQHQGFITTEQRLSLAKTTLDKLAAFKYKPFTEGQTSTRQIPPEDATGPSGHGNRSITLGPGPEKSDILDTFDAPELPGLVAACKPFNPKGYYDKVEVVNTNLEGNEMPSRHISEGLYASDAFDNCLDDHLLAIASFPATSQITLKGEPKKLNPTGVTLQMPCRSPKAAQSQCNPQLDDHGVISPIDPEVQDPGYSYESATAAISEPTDEYDMEKEDEEELLRLADLPESTKPFMNTAERFLHPTSVQEAIYIGSDAGEVYDSCLQFSPPKFGASSVPLDTSEFAPVHYTNNSSAQSPKVRTDLEPPLEREEEDWRLIRSGIEIDLSSPASKRVTHPPNPVLLSLPTERRVSMQIREQTTRGRGYLSSTLSVADDSNEYKKPRPFARPPFPQLMLDRCPVVGFSAQPFLRVCFRIGEMYREGARCHELGLDAVIELFTRVGFSSRESGSIKQHFQFLDLWHDRPPFATGILASYKTTGLAESESKVFLNGEGGKMARCLGKLRRDAKSNTGWFLQLINIRETDWEEIRWTRRIVSGDPLAMRKENLGPKIVQVAD